MNPIHPIDSLFFLHESQKTFNRLKKRLKDRLLSKIDTGKSNGDIIQAEQIIHKIETQFHSLFSVLHRLYGRQYDFLYHLETLLYQVIDASLNRSAELHELDRQREKIPAWFQSHTQVGGMLYVDLFAGNLDNLKNKIPYFKELGLTYIHLMPLFECPPNKNDGGYAITSYRKLDPKIGNFEDLKSLATLFRQNGICLVVDFVFNHTSSEHPWAKKAENGEHFYQDLYFTFNESEKTAYQQHLRDIFPTERAGSFTWNEKMNKWVLTTFHSYQWDLNYQNPETFKAMLSEMLFLANSGIDVLRLDALAFIWKQKGTCCENLPQAHLLIEAFNILVRLVAPAVIFKSEAIVHPDEVKKYISPRECHLSYNPLLMALLWNSLATRKVRLLRLAIKKRNAISDDCSWINYLRCHDDIGWTFDNDDAKSLGIKADDHRNFLNEFYRGNFKGSFARGVPFQLNPQTGDCRISGTLASLAGLEKALNEGNESDIDLSIRRIMLLNSVIFSIGGIPLIYMGDETGQLNDYSYLHTEHKRDDSRWIHRIEKRWGRQSSSTQHEMAYTRVFKEMIELIKLRKSEPLLNAGTQSKIIDFPNDHVFSFTRGGSQKQFTYLGNFSENPQKVIFKSPGQISEALNQAKLYDKISSKQLPLDTLIELKPYQFMWITTRN